MNFNWKKIYALKAQFNKKFGDIPEKPGIYLWTRYDPNINKTYFYVGQAKNLKNRRFNYYCIQAAATYPSRHFEYSLLAHKDWKYEIIEYCPEQDLNEREQTWIMHYLKKDNYITRNDMLTGKDTVKSNKKRITKIEKQYRDYLKKLLDKTDIFFEPNYIQINVELTKGKEATKKSKEALNELEKFIKDIKNGV